MTKQKVTTTYRREYSPERSAEAASAVRLHSAYVDYREYRRQLEHGHHKSPFTWDDWQFEEAALCEQQQQAAGGRRGEPTRHQAVQCETDALEEDPCLHLRRPPSRDQQIQTSLCHMGEDNPSLSTMKESSSSSSDGDCNCGAHMEKTHSPQARTKQAKTKPINKQQTKASGADNSPFIAYGNADKEIETGTKRTFNIQAKEGVYPSAIKADRRKQVALQLSKSSTSPTKTKYMFDPSFDREMNRQTSRWQSEYDKQYRGHHDNTSHHDNTYTRNHSPY